MFVEIGEGDRRLGIGCTGRGDRWTNSVVFRHLFHYEHSIVITAIKKRMYGILNNFSSFILPILRIWIPSFYFCRLFIRTSPCKLDVSQLVIWVKDCKINMIKL